MNGNKKTVIITGGSGFIGNYMISYLLSKNYDVIAIVRPNSQKKYLFEKYKQYSNFLYIEEYLEKIENIKNKVKNVDIFIHFAWDGVNREEIDSEYIQKNNVELSLICLKFAYDIGCKLFISSGSRSEYGDINGFVNENTEVNPISEYGKAKLKFCNEAKYFSDKNDIKILHIRIFSVYGINDHPWSLINSLIENLYKNTDMKLGLCEHYWNFMYIDDLIRAIYICCENILDFNIRHDIINIAQSESLQLKEYIYIIYQLLNSKSRLLFGSFKEAKGSVVSTCPDVSKLKNIYKFNEEISFEEGIKKIVLYKYPNFKFP